MRGLLETYMKKTFLNTQFICHIFDEKRELPD